MKNSWTILGIEPTDNKRTIKRAYAKKLKEFHPEDYPQEFKEIQDAYQSIIQSMQRDYTECSQINLEVKKGFSNVNAIYLNSLKEHGEEAVSENSDSHQNTSLYDVFSLSSSFAHIDSQTDKVENTSLQNDTIEISQQEDNKHDEILREFYYQKFIEQIKYHLDYESMHNLIMDKDFFSFMGEYDFYEKISRVVIAHISEFDVYVKSFLYDSFAIIIDKYHYTNKEVDVTVAIQEEQKRKQLQAKQKKQKQLIMIVLSILLLTLLVYGFINMSIERRAEEQKIKDQIDDINTWINDGQSKLQNENTRFVEEQILVQKGESFTCSVPWPYTENGVVMFTCYSKIAENKRVIGSLRLDENRKGVSINLGSE